MPSRHTKNVLATSTASQNSSMETVSDAITDPAGPPRQPTDAEIIVLRDDVVNTTQQAPTHGSTLTEATFNFTNCIIGAGAIGLGGAFAQSGGIISVLALILCAYLTKQSLDLVIRLSVEHGGESSSSYESLGQLAFGTSGRLVVMLSKFMYSFGCLVAYVVVIKDNFGSALRALIEQQSGSPDTTFVPTMAPTVAAPEDQLSLVLFPFLFYEPARLLEGDKLLTWLVSIIIILPLCLLRDMTPFARLSVLSVGVVAGIVIIILSLYMVNPHDEIRHVNDSPSAFYENWLQVRAGFPRCLGTFVFSFVSQHTVHLTFSSLRSDIRTVENWKKVSSATISIASTFSLLIGLGVYMSFWKEAKSDIFEIYPRTIPVVNFAKLLLCINMLLTFPLPFFACRELVIIMFSGSFSDDGRTLSEEESQQQSLQEPLLERADEDSSQDNEAGSSQSSQTTRDRLWSTLRSWLREYGLLNQQNSIFVTFQGLQLILPYHVALTFSLWLVVTFLAIVAPSLGDVLNLVGCASGTIIAFIFPAILSFRLEGYSYMPLMLFVVGSVVGCVGTFFSLRQLARDVGLA